MVAGIVVFTIAMLISLGGLIFSIYKSVNFTKDKRQTAPVKQYLTHIGIGIVTNIVFFIVGLFAIYIWNSYSPSWENYLQIIFGGLFFGASFSGGLCAFIIHYYKKNLDKKLDKYLFIWLMVSIPLSVLSLFLWTDGLVALGGENFLLPNGLNFAKGFVRPDSPDKPNIAFYAICILAGAILVYFIADHLMYKEYGKHGTLEATFFTAFPAGIIGARIAYVIGNWNTDKFGERVARGEWWSIFAIWEGGLTILGGAIAGILVGVLVYKKTNKGKPGLRVVDLVVPAILIAQAIGRWGNFFNCEVHGLLVEESGWSWLPKVVFNNAHYSSGKGLGWAPEGYIYLPLFFIEFLTNLAGYFIIAYLIGKLLKKHLKLGDLGACYIIWYGLTRMLLEPLRDPQFNMGEKGFWSWIWSLVFVAGGALLILINHLVRFYFSNIKNPYKGDSKKNFITSVCFYVPGLALLIAGIIVMINSTAVAALEFNLFNTGIILAVIGGSSCILGTIPLVQGIYSFRHKETPISA